MASASPYRRKRGRGFSTLYRGAVDLPSAVTSSPYLASDTFDRANAASLGTSSSGKVWDEHGAAWSIASNRAVPPSGGPEKFVTLDAGATDVVIDVTVIPGGSAPDLGICARVVDTNNLIYMDIVWVTDHWLTRVFQRLSGTFTGLTTLVNPVSGMGDNTTSFTATLHVVGDGGEAFINGASQGTWTGLDASLYTATNFGLGANDSASSAFNDLTISAA